MDPIENPALELPQDMWNDIVNFLQEEETLLTMTQVSKGTQDTAEKELTRRWAEQGFLLATGPDELASALADRTAQVIIIRGGTVDRRPAHQDAHVIAAGPVAVAGIGVVHIRDTIGTITGVTGGMVFASGAAQVTDVTDGTVFAAGATKVTNVTDGTVWASDSAQVTDVSDGYVRAFDMAQVTGVTGGKVDARNNARVTATGGEIRAYDHASVHSDGATVHVQSPNAMITATGGAIHLHVPNPKLTYSGDVTFFNDRGQSIEAPKAFGE